MPDLNRKLIFSRFMPIFWIVFILLPPSLVSLLVWRHGVNIPFWDQWDFVPFVKKANSSNLAFADFWAQHNEHRLVFPRIVMILLAKSSDWNTRLEMAANLLLAFVTFCVLLLLARRTYRDLRWVWWVSIAVPFSVLIFSPIQWGNWLWGWQIQWFLNTLAATGAVAFLTLIGPRRAWIGILGGLAMALVGQFSLANGFLIWLACVPVFLIRTEIRKYLPVWLVFAFLATGLYFQNYSRPGYHPAFSETYGHPAVAAEYTLNYIGGPLNGVSKPEADAIGFKDHVTGPGRPIAGAAILLGFMASGGFVVVKRRDLLELAGPWIGIGSYVIMSAGATALGRGGLGAHQAASSRYTTIATLLVVSTLGLISVTITGQRTVKGPLKPARILAGVGILFAAASLCNYGSGAGALKAWGHQRYEGKQCLLTATSETVPCLGLTYPRGEFAFQQASYLRQIGWGGFKDAIR